MLTLKQALRETGVVNKILGDPWGFDKKITKLEARDLIAHHGFELTDTADSGSDDDLEWKWGDSITFRKWHSISELEIWEHLSDCIGDLTDPSKCSCRGDIVRIV